MRSTLAKVRLEMAKLPVEQRAALMLVCVEGMSYQEAAGVLAIPVGTLMSRLARARLALASQMRQLQAGEGSRLRRISADPLKNPTGNTTGGATLDHEVPWIMNGTPVTNGKARPKARRMRHPAIGLGTEHR